MLFSRTQRRMGNSESEPGVKPAGWSNENAFVSEGRALRFKSRVGQIGHGVVNNLQRCNISS